MLDGCLASSRFDTVTGDTAANELVQIQDPVEEVALESNKGARRSALLLTHKSGKVERLDFPIAPAVEPIGDESVRRNLLRIRGSLRMDLWVSPQEYLVLTELLEGLRRATPPEDQELCKQGRALAERVLGLTMEEARSKSMAELMPRAEASAQKARAKLASAGIPVPSEDDAIAEDLGLDRWTWHVASKATTELGELSQLRSIRTRLRDVVSKLRVHLFGDS